MIFFTSATGDWRRFTSASRTVMNNLHISADGTHGPRIHPSTDCTTFGKAAHTPDLLGAIAKFVKDDAEVLFVVISALYASGRDGTFVRPSNETLFCVVVVHDVRAPDAEPVSDPVNVIPGTFTGQDHPQRRHPQHP